MALKLKRGQKNQVWEDVVVTHRDDLGTTFEDTFQVLVRLPADVDELEQEAKALTGTQDDKALPPLSAVDYLEANVLGWRKLESADDQEIPYTPENFADLVALVPYRRELMNVVSRTRRKPGESQRKNS
ncbi:hypothetical protein JN531_012760 [Flagellatimonas centrodinii]|uniref:hypothetical protein n=1 Tax=Flagellatimonas centrodinii TaxID=2806210 RepID=UPI001FEF651D|nr:hypothetical protein [Flagellatimonas centrodinii]ULQ45971.1 hypothetical protein JN531_012760 [Flagellatimonas centrodinii]